MTLTAEPEHIKRLRVVLVMSIYSGFAAAVLTNVASNKGAVLYSSFHFAVSTDLFTVIVVPFAYLSVVLLFIFLTPIAQIAISCLKVLANPFTVIGFKALLIRHKPFCFLRLTFF